MNTPTKTSVPTKGKAKNLPVSLKSGTKSAVNPTLGNNAGVSGQATLAGAQGSKSRYS